MCATVEFELNDGSFLCFYDFAGFKDLQAAVRKNSPEAEIINVHIVTDTTWKIPVKVFTEDVYDTLCDALEEAQAQHMTDIYAGACWDQSCIMSWDDVAAAYCGTYMSYTDFGESVFMEVEHRDIVDRLGAYIDFTTYGKDLAMDYAVIKNDATEELYFFWF